MARDEHTDPEALDLRQKIVGLMEDHAVSPLLETILEYLRKFPKSEWGWLVAAPTLIDLGRYGDAKAALANAQEYGATENLPTVCYWRCVLHKERGDLKRAERWIRRALEHDDSNGAHWVTLGDVLAKRGKAKAARKALKSAIALGESSADEAHYNLALLLRAKRDYEGALAEVARALAIDPEYPEAHALRRDLDAVRQGAW